MFFSNLYHFCTTGKTKESETLMLQGFQTFAEATYRIRTDDLFLTMEALYLLS